MSFACREAGNLSAVRATDEFVGIIVFALIMYLLIIPVVHDILVKVLSV